MKIYEIYPTYRENWIWKREYDFSKNGLYNILEKWEEKNEHLSEYSQFSYLWLKNNPDFYKDIEMVIKTDTRWFDVDLEEISQYHKIYLCTEKFKQVCEKYNIPFNFYPTQLRGERWYLVSIENLPRVFKCESIESNNKLDSQIIQEIVKYHWYTLFTDKNMVWLYITEKMAENFKKEWIEFNLKDAPQLTLWMSEEEVKKYIEDRKDEIQKEKDWVSNKEIKVMEVVKWCMEKC